MTRRLINLAYGLLVAAAAVAGVWLAATGSPVQGLILLAVATGMVYIARR